MKFLYIKSISSLSLLLLLLTLSVSSCKKLVEVPPPATSISEANVYANDASATSVLTGIYTQMSIDNRNISGLSGLFFYAGLSSDELNLYDVRNTDYLAYYTNQLTDQMNSGFWSWVYPYIFYTNSAIEGLSNSNSLTPEVKNQLLGEAKFLRAFYYFYLVNLYGDVCLATGTDWQVNSLLPRVDKLQSWMQIIADLKEAQTLLNNNYVEADAVSSKSSTERVRPNKWAATALLARAYLYTGNWNLADSAATAVINNTAIYDTVPLSNAFLKKSKETIWQIQSTGSSTLSNTGEGLIFVLPNSGPDYWHPAHLNNNLLNSFEENDKRKAIWLDSVVVSNNVFYYPYKYKIGEVNTSSAEYSIVLRLAEQYLIRAEARAHQNNLNGAADDLNRIRSRAGLPKASPSTQLELLDVILHERQVELFTEWGHRWLDLLRTGKVNSVMSIATPNKGGTWNTNWQLYPLPLMELQKNPNLFQNLGY